jgi:hypothetical protein
MEFTFATFQNPDNDHELRKQIQDACNSVKLDPAKIRELASSSEITKLKIRSHAEAQFHSAMGDERVSLDGWIKTSVENHGKAKIEEQSRFEELKKLEATGGHIDKGKSIVDLPPHVKTKVWLCRAISIAALVIGYVSTFRLLYTQVGWDMWLAATVPFIPVGLLGGGVKIFFDNLASHGKKQWNIGFYSIFVLVILTGLGFFYLLAQEYGKDILEANVGTEWLRFFLGLSAEVFGAGLAWAYSDKLIQEHTRMDGIATSQQYIELERRLKEATTEKNRWDTRITLAKSMIGTIQSADANLQAEAERLFEEVSKKL